MEQKALVVSTENEKAVIEVARVSACENCHKMKDGDSCAVCSLFNLKNTMRADAVNRIGAEPGDIVVIETPSRTMIGYAALVFLVPVLVGIACYFLVSALTTLKEGYLALISAASVLLVFVILHFTVDRTASGHATIQIVSVEKPYKNPGIDAYSPKEN